MIIGTGVPAGGGPVGAMIIRDDLVIIAGTNQDRRILDLTGARRRCRAAGGGPDRRLSTEDGTLSYDNHRSGVRDLLRSTVCGRCCEEAGVALM
ncbi:MAG TPA: hypothetical protein VF892_16370, partial [Pseudonocardiaceae bacterium]